ncbi:hypothetical protein MKW92_009469 [Papaver armeniacum]|nr:hypothetical protein MKW92_009469 [Papaver armeniacum]
MKKLLGVWHPKRLRSPISGIVSVLGASILIFTVIIFISPSSIPMLQNNLSRFYNKFTFSHLPVNVNSSTSIAALTSASDSSSPNSTQMNGTKNLTYSNYSSIIDRIGPPEVGGLGIGINDVFSSRVIPTNSSGSNDRKKQQNGDDCNIFDGEWVWVDDRLPYYPPGSCPYVVEGSNFDCGKNGRTDHQFLKWRWQWLSAGCDSNIPRILNATDFLERLRGKKVAFAGDSLNRNMFSSLACIFWNAVADKSKVYWLQGGALSVRFEDYNCTVGFVPSPFLVYETKPQNRELVRMRLDLIDPRASLFYRDADIVVFNSWHWWAKNKVHNGTNYFQEGDYLYTKLEINKAFKKALSTWSKWIDNNIDPNKTQVVFRGHSISHFMGGPWNKGGRCDGVTEPLMSNKTFREKNPSGVKSIEDTLRQMKTPVIYLNITKQTYYRTDGHPSIYTRSYKNKMKQDCAHWCLPGVPDAWNELLYISLLRAGKGSFAL